MLNTKIEQWNILLLVKIIIKEKITKGGGPHNTIYGNDNQIERGQPIVFPKLTNPCSNPAKSHSLQGNYRPSLQSIVTLSLTLLSYTCTTSRTEVWWMPQNVLRLVDILKNNRWTFLGPFCALFVCSSVSFVSRTMIFLLDFFQRCSIDINFVVEIYLHVGLLGVLYSRLINGFLRDELLALLGTTWNRPRLRHFYTHRLTYSIL